MAFTADDARVIADQFLEAAEAIDDFLDANKDTISQADNDVLRDAQRNLLRSSASMTTAAVGLSIDQMADAAAELGQVITEAKESLAELESIGKAIRVAAGLVDLATAIIAKNPGGAFKAVKALREELA
jgi:chlorite dismutase